MLRLSQSLKRLGLGAVPLALVLVSPSLAGGDGDEALRSGPAGTEDGALRVRARYSSSVLIFKVGEVELEAVFSDHEYSARSTVGAAGLAALFTDFDIQAQVAGERSPSGVQPREYAHVERTGDKVRSVTVSFDDQVAESRAEPPFGSWGQPPASAAERTGVLDPMTAFFALSDALAASPGETCSGRIPVFDGKQRYDLRLEDAGLSRIRTRAWQGEARVCEAYYEPISGYDPEDYPSESELRHPLTIWLAAFPDSDIHLPVRLHTRAGFGGVTIEARDIRIDRI